MKLSFSVAFLMITGCSSGQPDDAGDRNDYRYEKAFHYAGFSLKFPRGTVDSRTDNRPWARLIPDRPQSGDAIDARYYIDLGRKSTGTSNAIGYGLGASTYAADERPSDLGNHYRLYCNSRERDPLLFTCAALLRALPLAAVQFRDRPSSPAAARKIILEAEVFLLKAKGQDLRPLMGKRKMGRPTE